MCQLNSNAVWYDSNSHIPLSKWKGMSHSVQRCSHITSLASDVFNGLMGIKGDMEAALRAVAERHIPWDLNVYFGRTMASAMQTDENTV